MLQPETDPLLARPGPREVGLLGMGTCKGLRTFAPMTERYGMTIPIQHK